MPVYAIGDIQGCHIQLQRLLDRLRFDPDADRLWLAGDLVNRGPQSLAILRFVRSLGASAITVLGNHDLHLLAVAAGAIGRKARDHLDDVLNARDRDELLDWLRRRPLLHHDEDLGFTLVHAGLVPQWDLDQARSCAAEVEEALAGPACDEFLRHMYGNRPNLWSGSLSGWERLRFITNCLTRLRYCDRQGAMHLESSGPPGTQPQGCLPWFSVPGRANADLRIVFGHWSTLTLVHRNYPGVYPLDTGCVWGRALTAMRLDGEHEIVHVDCPDNLTAH